MPKCYVVAGWDDVPHIEQSTKDALFASYPVHERDVRTKGIPKLGSGAIYPLDDSMILVEPYLIPKHFRRLGAIDFGIKNPALVWMAYDEDTDACVIYDVWKGDGETTYATGHIADVMKSRGAWIPFAWPHDGRVEQSDDVERADGVSSGDGVSKAAQFRAKGVNMLVEHAQHAEEGIGDETKKALTSVRGGIDSIYEAMMEGRFKVFSNLDKWFSEKNAYHRKDGKIVKKRDHLMDASRYLWISRRFASLAPNESTARRDRPNWKTA